MRQVAHQQVPRPVGELGGRARLVRVLHQAAGDVGALGVHALQDNAGIDALAHHVKHRRALGRLCDPARMASGPLSFSTSAFTLLLVSNGILFTCPS